MQEDLNHIMWHTSNLWEEIRGQNIFITGGTGFIGTWLLESFTFANDLFDLNATAFVLTRNQETFADKAPHLAMHPNIQFVEGDILSFKFPPGRYSHIIHAATETSHALIDAEPLLAFDAIVSGMTRVLGFAEQAGTKKLLFISSGAVYGKQLPHITHITEDSQGAPDLFDTHAVYGEGKRVAEMLGYFSSGKVGVEFKVARCFAFIGPHMPLDQHFAIGNFIYDALQGGPIRVKGDGTPYRSYMYAADLVVWLWSILFKGVSCRPYNVGSDVDMQIKDFAGYVANEVPGGAEVIVKEAPDESRPAERYVPDVSRARQELDLSLEISFQEGVRRTIRSFENIQTTHMIEP